jgi:CheY-like chemotaxis protein
VVLSPTPSADLPRVLFVDDEPNVLGVLSRILDRTYRVSTCSSAGEALELFVNGARFDVIVCDNKMPIISGPELYDLVAARWPAQAARFAFLAGSPIDASTPSAARPFFEKPIDARSLRASVDELVSCWGRVIHV